MIRTVFEYYIQRRYDPQRPPASIASCALAGWVAFVDYTMFEPADIELYTKCFGTLIHPARGCRYRLRLRWGWPFWYLQITYQLVVDPTFGK